MVINKHENPNQTFVKTACILGLFYLSACSFDIENNKVDLPSYNIGNIIDVGNAWGNNAINTTIYRHHGIVTIGNYQILAFFVDAQHLRVVKRNIKSNITEPAIWDISGIYDVSDSHNTASIGIDNLGYIHLSYAQHANKLRYRRSMYPMDITKWTDEISMTGLREKHVTYPAFIIPRNSLAESANRDLLFFYRDGRSGKGDICIKKYNSSMSKWKDVEPCIIIGSKQTPWTSDAYLNPPAIDNSGNIHLSYVWRTHFLDPKKILNNIGIDYANSRDWGKTWQTSLGREYRLPITQVNSETVYAVSPGNNLINQTSSATDSLGNLHIVYYANDSQGVPQYQHVWFDGKKWRHSLSSARTKSFLLHGAGSLDIPISRPEILIDSKDRFYLIYRGDLSGNKMAVTRFMPPEYDLQSSSTKILWDKEVGYAEPVIDRLRWEKEQILSMFIQKNDRASNRDVTQRHYESAYIVDWDIVKLW